MRVSTTWNPGEMRILMRLDAGENLDAVGQGNMAIRLVTNEATVRHESIGEDTHPDLIALAILTIVQPWIRTGMELDFGVSDEFASAVESAFGFGIGPIDSRIAPRTQGTNIGLSYSGGVDSLALLNILPSASPLVHLRRVRHHRVPDRALHLRSDVSEAFARRANRIGRTVDVVTTDLEYLCQPFPTYPTWPAIGIGAVLLGDHLDLGALAFGMILGARYLSEGSGWDPDRKETTGWFPVFEAVGLPLFMGIAGMTEVGTNRLIESLGQGDLARSCQLGPLDHPCWNCQKCLRMELIRSAGTGQDLPSLLLDRLSTNQMILDHFASPPPYLQQHILEYALARVPGLEGTFLEPVRDLLQPTVSDTEWVTRIYEPSLDELPDPWRDPVAQALLAHTDPMTEEDRIAVESWSRG